MNINDLLMQVKERTIRRIQNIHVLHRSASYECLDLNITALTMPEMIQSITEYMEKADPDSIPTAAPDRDWMQLAKYPQPEGRVGHQFDEHYFIRVNGRRISIGVISCQ